MYPCTHKTLVQIFHVACVWLGGVMVTASD